MEAKPDKESLNELMVKYFVPPLTGQYMQWTQTIMIFIFLIALFVFVLYWYVYVNYSDYQNRISVITNAYLFGKNPQLEFEQYIKNAQENSLDAAVNNIQSNASEVINESSRLNKSANRLAAKVAVDLPQNQAETSNLGISILGNIAKLRDTISKLYDQSSLTCIFRNTKTIYITIPCIFRNTKTIYITQSCIFRNTKTIYITQSWPVSFSKVISSLIIYEIYNELLYSSQLFKLSSYYLYYSMGMCLDFRYIFEHDVFGVAI
jgi:hypothetical protein